MTRNNKVHQDNDNIRRGTVQRLSASVAVTSRSSVDEQLSKSAGLLVKSGYVAQLGAGLHMLLPLGLRVLRRIEDLVRTEMNVLGANEFLSPVIYPKELWSVTGRWESIDVLYKLASRGGAEFCLSATAEEVVSFVGKGLIRSYRDLPLSMYQIQTKCRDELRPRSGLIRGREFRMKDLYSFHLDADELDEFYERVCASYMKIFKACGIGDHTVRTFASGGVFSRFSDEFQLVCDSGEDTIFLSEDNRIAINSEIASDEEARGAAFGGKDVKLTQCRGIEVGNTFKLGTRFSDAFDLKVADSKGARRSVLMCSYGIGTTRLIGAIAEICNDEKGLIWPRQITPYDAHVIALGEGGALDESVGQVIDILTGEGLSVLLDDRQDRRAGEKFADADLIGIPSQIVLGNRMTGSVVEIKDRRSGIAEMVDVTRLNDLIRE